MKTREENVPAMCLLDLVQQQVTENPNGFKRSFFHSHLQSLFSARLSKPHHMKNPGFSHFIFSTVYVL